MQAPFPKAVLFNGGVMKAEPLREQILTALRQWSDNPELQQFDSR